MEASHESAPQAGVNLNTKRRVPRFIFVMILVCFAGLYWYAVYGDTPTASPEKTVTDFYQAYFNRDFDTVAQNLSVFWSVRFLPEYASMSAAELLENSPQIEKDIASVISEIEQDNQIPSGVTVDIIKDYTRVGQDSAIVVYDFNEDGTVTSREAAILILENGQFKIFNMSPVDDSVLEQIKTVDMNSLDKNFEELLNSSQVE